MLRGACVLLVCGYEEQLRGVGLAGGGGDGNMRRGQFWGI